jgi:hypothetical protein
MDPRAHFSTHQSKSGSLYGFDLTRYIGAVNLSGISAHEAAVRVLTHGGIYPLEQAIKAIGLYDRAAIAIFAAHPQLRVVEIPQTGENDLVLSIYVNTLGRLHIRPTSTPKVKYSEEDSSTDIGFVVVDRAVADAIMAHHDTLELQEAQAFVEIKAATDGLHARNELEQVLEEVIDHVEHVESVGFYLGDRFLARIDRYVNLVDDKRRKGFLNSLRDKPYLQWRTEEILAVAALHALFLSGRSVRFEEFNGILLTPSGLLARLNELAEAYRTAGCEVEMPVGLDLFERARVIRQQTLRATGKPWLRYRWIYGLNFQKVERILPTTETSEADDVWLRDLGDDYRDLVGGDMHGVSEHVGTTALANACLARDVAGIACNRGSSAANGWIEYLMEKIVASAVLATNSDYGMSSSLRDISRLVTYDEATLIDAIHAVTPQNFFTCFVSNGMIERLGTDEARAIASSVQKRMMFNRWHFIPGNLERPLVRMSRHWYYPPLIPDIAAHSDMHRAAHNQARVKYSIRAPGPDMSRPALHIANRRYRGFYDVRVVRTEGDGYTVDDMVRTRRRTLWLEAVYEALVNYLMSTRCKRLQITGFQPGSYYDIPGAEADREDSNPAYERYLRPPVDTAVAAVGT